MTTGIVNNSATTVVDGRRHACDRQRVSDLATRIRELASARGFSERGLSIAAGLSPTTVNKLLTRLELNPHLRVEERTLDLVADALGVSRVWLRTGQGDPDQAPQPKPSEPTNDVSTSARLKNLANWPALLAAGRALRPLIPLWVWVMVGNLAPLFSKPPTPAMIADLADLVMRHESPPSS